MRDGPPPTHADGRGRGRQRGRFGLRRLADRLYLVGRDGRIAYRGGEGPFGFKPNELGAAIEHHLKKGALR